MERERQGKNLVIAGLLVTVLCMSVAFAALTNVKLNVAGTANLPNPEWDVAFTNAEVATGSNIDTEPTFSTNTVSYTIELVENSTYIVNATITNNGTYTAEVVGVTPNSSSITGHLVGLIRHEITGLAVGDTIAPGKTKTLTITVDMGTIESDEQLAAVKATNSLSLSAVVEFKQA